MISTIDYWEKRARRHGKLSVLNLGHTEKEFDKVTEMQKRILLPILKRQLSGNEKVILDFGCGPGRFTPDLADIIHGQAIGVDPIKKLLELALIKENVEYRLMKNDSVPLENASVDVAWICLTLGGLTHEKEILNAISEISRVIKNEGMLNLVEI
jgi:ubiquinone/menaquinone biosynthesis C-methylase UbiE